MRLAFRGHQTVRRGSLAPPRRPLRSGIRRGQRHEVPFDERLLRAPPVVDALGTMAKGLQDSEEASERHPTRGEGWPQIHANATRPFQSLQLCPAPPK